MTLFKSVLKGVALTGAIALLSTGALAGGLKDDGPRPFSWTGFYAGVNAGYAWGDADLKSTAACPDGTGCAYLASQTANLETIGRLGSGSISESGFTGGVQVGYNQQRGNTVFGLELDFNALDVGGSQLKSGGLPSTDPTTTANVTTSFSADWLLTLRGRAGVTISPTVLAYVTGGLAISEINVANAYRDNNQLEAVSGASSSSETKVGWTVGGGVEWAIGNNWTFKGEYLYVDLGSTSTKADFLPPSQAGILTPNTLNSSVDLTTHIARGGINYKF